MTGNSQKFIARNRAPRVQIEYDVELYGSEKKVQLPFVMGVMSDLAGKSKVAQPELADRSFLEIDMDNFDDRMRAMAPRAAFSVPNTLTGEGNIEIDLTFEKMADFSPAAIAAKVEPLRPLLEARTQLSNLMAYMDGKAGAEALIERILADPSLLAALAGPSGSGDADSEAALQGLRDLAPPPEAPETDEAGSVLEDLKDAAPVDDRPDDDRTEDILGGLAAAALDDLLGDLAADAPGDDPAADPAAAALDSLGAAGPPADEQDEQGDDTGEILSGLSGSAPDETRAPDLASAVLDDLAAATPDEAEDADDEAAAALDSLASAEVPEDSSPDTSLDDLLGDLAADAPGDEQGDDQATAALDDLAEIETPDAGTADPDLDDLLGDLAAIAPHDDRPTDTTAEVLGSLPASEPGDDGDGGTDLDDLLGDLAAAAPDDTAEAGSDLDALLGDLAAPSAEDTEMPEDPADESLAGMPGDAPEGQHDEAAQAEFDAAPVDGGSGDDLDSLLAGLGDAGQAQDAADASLDDLLDDIEHPPEAGGDDAGLDDLLAGLGGSADAAPPDGDEDASLDDLLAGLGGEGDPDNLDDLLGELSGQDDQPPEATAPDENGDPGSAAHMTGEPEFAFGTMSADRPDPQRLHRQRFRLAILGDFSGRAARGLLETGDALAARRAILLDPDTVEDVIEGFATDLVLPIGRDGAGVAVRLGGLDDLHPDELYEKVGLFSELAGLRGQLASGATAENAAARLRDWAEKHGQPVAPAKSRSAGSTVPADLKLSDFQRLIGDTGAKLAQPSPLDDLLARIVGPHVRALPDPDAEAMKTAVDEALSAAMRLVLHHPEFQTVEAQWRSIDLIARSIETDDTLDVMLYDISAEEIAADLAAAGDLSQSGLARLLTEEPLDEENGRGGYSALIGLYTFEVTPPHAELLGRIARVAAHVDAPFFAAITPGFLDTELKDRHPLVAQAWDRLRGMPEAGHLGLVTPRFLLRRPYGAKSEPIYEFEFEEFTMAEGMKGMLWANPAVLVAILLARSFRENGPRMNLGSIMSLGGMPYHYVTDRFGDQVALPCTERNMTLDKIETAVLRGYMSVASVKGRDELRLTSFQSLAGTEILGPWSGAAPPPPSPPDPAPEAEDMDTDAGTGDDTDLDDLLAGFGEDAAEGDGEDGDVDAELAALLDDL